MPQEQGALQELLKNDIKVYVDVNEDRCADGRLVPRSMIWEDGELYEIDRVIDVCRAASLKAGGVGMRYTVEIEGKTTYMWLEEDRWFVVRKK